MRKILVTGSAGFIGANLMLRLLDSPDPLHLLGCVGLVFILSTAADLIRLYVLERPLSKLLDALDPLFRKLDDWFNV